MHWLDRITAKKPPQAAAAPTVEDRATKVGKLEMLLSLNDYKSPGNQLGLLLDHIQQSTAVRNANGGIITAETTSAIARDAIGKFVDTLTEQRWSDIVNNEGSTEIYEQLRASTCIEAAIREHVKSQKDRFPLSKG